MAIRDSDTADAPSHWQPHQSQTMPEELEPNRSKRDPSAFASNVPHGGIDVAAVHKMTNKQVLAYAAFGPPITRPIESTMADSEQQPLSVNEKVLIVVADDARYGRLYQRRTHKVEHVEADKVWFRPLDHRAPASLMALPPRSDRVQRWSQELSDTATAMNTALNRVRKLIHHKRMQLPVPETCSDVAASAAYPQQHYAPNEAPTSHPCDDGTRSSDSDAQNPSCVQSARTASTARDPLASCFSDSVLDNASSLGYVFERSQPPGVAASCAPHRHAAEADASDNASTSVSSSIMSINSAASESEMPSPRSTPSTSVTSQGNCFTSNTSGGRPSELDHSAACSSALNQLAASPPGSSSAGERCVPLSPRHDLSRRCHEFSIENPSDEPSQPAAAEVSAPELLYPGQIVTRAWLESLVVIDLRRICKQQVVSTSGSKNDLILRVINSVLSCTSTQEQLDAFSDADLRLCCGLRGLVKSGSRAKLVSRLLQTSEQPDGVDNVEQRTGAAGDLHHVADSSTRGRPFREELENLPIVQLQSLARAKGVSAAGSKRDLVLKLILQSPGHLNELSARQLSAICRDRGLPISGLKHDLIAAILCQSQQQADTEKSDQIMTSNASSMQSSQLQQHADSCTGATASPVDGSAACDPPLTRDHLESLNRQDLRTLCQSKGVPKFNRLKKDDLISRLQLYHVAEVAITSGRREQLEVFTNADLKDICRAKALLSFGSKRAILDRLMQSAERKGSRAGDQGSADADDMLSNDAAVRCSAESIVASKPSMCDELRHNDTFCKQDFVFAPKHSCRVSTEQVCGVTTTSSELDSGVFYRSNASLCCPKGQASGKRSAANAIFGNAIPIPSGISEGIAACETVCASKSCLECVASGRTLTREQIIAFSTEDLKAFAETHGIKSTGHRRALIFRLHEFLLQRARRSGNCEQLLMLSYNEVKELCRAQDVSMRGAKEELVARLMQPSEGDSADMQSDDSDDNVSPIDEELSQPSVETTASPVDGSAACDPPLTRDHLESLNRQDLRTLCQSKGVPKFNRLKKDDLISRLQLYHVAEVAIASGRREQLEVFTNADLKDICRAKSLLSFGSKRAILDRLMQSAERKGSRAGDQGSADADDMLSNDAAVRCSAESRVPDGVATLEDARSSADNATAFHAMRHFGTPSSDCRTASLMCSDAVNSLQVSKLGFQRNASNAARDDFYFSLPLSREHLQVLAFSEQCNVAQARGQRPHEGFSQFMHHPMAKVSSSICEPHVIGVNDNASKRAAASGQFAFLSELSASHASLYPQSRSEVDLQQLKNNASAAAQSAAAENDASACLIEPSNRIPSNAFANGAHPIPYLAPIRRLSKICEHQRPFRLCLMCTGTLSLDVPVPRELELCPFNAPAFSAQASVSRSGIDPLCVLDELQTGRKRFRDSMQPAFSTSFGITDDPAEAMAAALLKKQVQAAAQSATSRLKPSAPARIVCMALLHDKSRCRMPGVFPDDGDLWFCGLHKDKQRHGVYSEKADSCDT